MVALCKAFKNESGHVKKTVFFGFQMKNPKTPIRMGDEAKLIPQRDRNLLKTPIFSEISPKRAVLDPF